MFVDTIAARAKNFWRKEYRESIVDFARTLEPDETPSWSCHLGALGNPLARCRCYALPALLFASLLSFELLFTLNLIYGLHFSP